MLALQDASPSVLNVTVKGNQSNTLSGSQAKARGVVKDGSKLEELVQATGSYGRLCAVNGVVSDGQALFFVCYASMATTLPS